jgi:hypothetical protein
LRRGQLPIELLARYGGPFDMGDVIELGTTTPAGSPPAIEDHTFDPANAVVVGAMHPNDFWNWLSLKSKTRLIAIFGSHLHATPTGRGTLSLGTGLASLGLLVPQTRPSLYIQYRDGHLHQVRMDVSDGDFDLDLAVTDIRLYGEDHLTPSPPAVQAIAARLGSEIGVILGVGLSRPYAPRPSAPAVHWLQVNSIHLADDPGWRLG